MVCLLRGDRAHFEYPQYIEKVIDELPWTLVGRVAYNELTMEDKSDGAA